MYWDIKFATHTMDPADMSEKRYHAKLTLSGREKLRARRKSEAVDLLPGIDYRVRDEPPENADWIPMPETDATVKHRHTWVFERRPRPVDPSFIHCPMPRRGAGEQERNAAIILTYFHPFTLNQACATEHVPFLGHLCSVNGSWHQTLLHWLDGHILCEEARRHVSNFLVVSRARPDGDASGDEHSDDLISDEALCVNSSSFDAALQTRIGSGRTDEKEKNEEG